jgi:hypothetical protein
MSKRKAEDPTTSEPAKKPATQPENDEAHRYVFVIMHHWNPQSSGGDRLINVKGVFSSLPEANKEALAIGKEVYPFWSDFEDDKEHFLDFRDPKHKPMYGSLGDEAGVIIKNNQAGEISIKMDEGEASGLSRVWVVKQRVQDRSEERVGSPH